MNSGKVLLGVLAGIAAGAMLGVLMAPEKGSVSRKKISKKGEYYADELKGKFNEFLDVISEKFEKVKKEVSAFTELGKSNLDKAEKEVKSATE
jgi:gas vesicle protein